MKRITLSKKSITLLGLLQKHESSLLVQIRTGKIGLRAFLHSRRVPGVTSPGCECGAGRETALHLILECRDTISQRWDLMEALEAATPTDRSSLAEATKSGTTGGETGAVAPQARQA